MTVNGTPSSAIMVSDMHRLQDQSKMFMPTPSAMTCKPSGTSNVLMPL